MYLIDRGKLFDLTRLEALNVKSFGLGEGIEDVRSQIRIGRPPLGEHINLGLGARLIAARR